MNGNINILIYFSKYLKILWHLSIPCCCLPVSQGEGGVSSRLKFWVLAAPLHIFGGSCMGGSYRDSVCRLFPFRRVGMGLETGVLAGAWWWKGGWNGWMFWNAIESLSCLTSWMVLLHIDDKIIAFDSTVTLHGWTTLFHSIPQCILFCNLLIQ